MYGVKENTLFSIIINVGLKIHKRMNICLKTWNKKGKQKFPDRPFIVADDIADVNKAKRRLFKDC
jgi:hypothetical protein